MKTLFLELWHRLTWWRQIVAMMKYTKKEDDLEGLLFCTEARPAAKASPLLASMTMAPNCSMLSIANNNNTNNNNNTSKVSFYQLFVLILIFSFIFLFGTFFYIRLNHNFAYPPSASGGWPSPYEETAPLDNTAIITTDRIEYLSDQFRLVRAKAKQRHERVKLELHNSMLKLRAGLNQNKCGDIASSNDCDIVIVGGDGEQRPEANNDTSRTIFLQSFDSWSHANRSTAATNMAAFVSTFQRRQVLCSVLSYVRKFSVFLRQPFAPLCFDLNEQEVQSFFDVSDALGYSTQWLLEYPEKNAQVLTNVLRQNERDHLADQIRTIKDITTGSENGEPLLWQYYNGGRLISMARHPIRARFVVLVTSLNPLVAFLYDDGVTVGYNRSQHAAHNQHDHFQSHSILWSYLHHSYGPKIVTKVRASIRRVILCTLISAEIVPHLNVKLFNRTVDRTKNVVAENATTTSATAYQLLAIDLVIDRETFEAYLVDAFDLESAGGRGEFLPPTMINSIYEQMESILVRTLSPKMFAKLEQLLDRLLGRDTLGLLGVNCHISHQMCLSLGEIRSLLETFGQIENARNFRPLFPLIEFDLVQSQIKSQDEEDVRSQLTLLFDEIFINLNSQEQNSQRGHRNNKKLTLSLSSFVYQTEKLFLLMNYILQEHWRQHLKDTIIRNRSQARAKANNDHEHDHNVDTKDDLLFPLPAQWPPRTNKTSKTTDNDEGCSEHFSKLATLLELEIVEPRHLRLSPAFDAHTTHYHLDGEASYRDVLLSLRFKTAHCHSMVAIEGQQSMRAGTLNFTLGLGDNQISLPVVIQSANNAGGGGGGGAGHEVALQTYTIYIRRLTRAEQYPLADWARLNPNRSRSLQICSLHQDCDLVIEDNQSCGLQPLNYTLAYELRHTWAQFFQSNIEHNDHLSVDNFWAVPCFDCSHEASCDWEEIFWKAADMLPVLDQSQLSTCFGQQQQQQQQQPRRLIFLGDSTNRGIMHYLLERINGTLATGDKTHGHRSYSLPDVALNVDFVYYPQFWLGPQQPSFESVIDDLFETLAAGNATSESVVLVVGGVQWMSGAHLHTVATEMVRYHLHERMHVVAKTLGSGFHQHVSGVHHRFNAADDGARNAQLVATARHLHMSTVDTFHPTVALFRDFYAGKCACHFHRIVATEDHEEEEEEEEMEEDSDDDADSDNHGHRFHVEGHINRVYAEQVLANICHG